jgi:hypothetical protein
MGGYGAPVVHSSVAFAPVIYGSHSGIYGSAYLSRKLLKRAIKYGSYYGALAAVAYSPLTQSAYGAPFPQGSMVTVTTSAALTITEIFTAIICDFACACGRCSAAHAYALLTFHLAPAYDEL